MYHAVALGHEWFVIADTHVNVKSSDDKFLMVVGLDWVPDGGGVGLGA